MMCMTPLACASATSLNQAAVEQTLPLEVYITEQILCQYRCSFETCQQRKSQNYTETQTDAAHR